MDVGKGEAMADVPGEVPATSLQDAGEGHLDTGLSESQVRLMFTVFSKSDL